MGGLGGTEYGMRKTTQLHDFAECRAAEHPGSYFSRARAAGDDRFYLIVVYQGASDPKEHMLIYFAMAKNAFGEDGPVPKSNRAAVKRTWERFLNGSDEYRNARWKVIPGIPEGAWAVQKAFGNTPTLLATKLTHTWHCSTAPAIPDSTGKAQKTSSHDAAFGGVGAEGSSSSTAAKVKATGHASNASVYGGYLEVDCDVASSTMASYLVNLLLANAKDVVVNLGFVVEAQEEDELPEHLLGTATIKRPHYERMPKVAVGNMQQADAQAAEAAAGSWGGWFGGWGGSGEPQPAK